MENIARILFPVDLSPASPKLVPYVVMMAEKFESEIHLLFVARRLQHLSSMYIPDPDIYTFEQGILEGAGRRLDEFRSEHFMLPAETVSYTETEELDEFKNKHFMMPADIRTAVVAGDPAEEIIRYAQSEKIDMILMGTHGRKGLNKIVFGSVAERVVKSSPVPVFIANPYRIQ